MEKLSLSKLHLYNILLFAIGFFIIAILFQTYYAKYEFDYQAEKIKTTYIKHNEKLIKKEVNFIVKTIDSEMNHKLALLHQQLDERLSLVKYLYKNIQTSSNLSSEEVLQKVFSLLKGYSWDRGSGYFYVFDTEGVIHYHGGRKEYIGAKLKDLLSEAPRVYEILQKAISQGYADGVYEWEKPNDNTSEMFHKYISVKQLEGTSLFVAAGIYIDTIEKELQSKLLEEMAKIRFGDDNYGYFWIHDTNYKMILHPREQMMRASLKDFKTFDGQYFFQEVNKMVEKDKEGYVHYEWYFPDNDLIDRKISYVKKTAHWNWIVGTGFYFNDLKNGLEKEKNALKDRLFSHVVKEVIALFVLFIVVLSIALYISRRFSKVEKDQKYSLIMLEQYKFILDKSAIVSKTDLKGYITYVNDSFCELSAFTQEEVMGQNHNIVRHPSNPKDTFKEMWNTIQDGKIWKGILKNRKKEGKGSYYIRTTIVPIKDTNGQIMEYMSAGTNVTELIEQRGKLNNFYLTDTLTSLSSRIKLLEDISKADKNGILALMDIDNFHSINSMFGEDTGDEIIKEVASRLYKFSLNEKIMIYKMRADIFAIYTVDLSMEQFLNMLQKRLIPFMTKHVYHQQLAKFHVSFTIGIAQGDCELVACADMTLNSAKNKKVSLLIYDTKGTMLQEHKDKIYWMNELNEAIKEDRIVPYYQPIFCYVENRISKYEVLVRMIGKDKEVISPGKFLDIAKKTKLYPKLTQIVVTKAALYFSQHREYNFSLNLTLEDLLSQDTMSYLYSVMKRYDLFENLIIEIVESEEMQSFDQVLSTLNDFKQAGAKIAIDDFGSGYSNYNYLLQLDIDFIKIDGSITERIHKDPGAKAIITSIVRFAQKSHIETIAEFVSSEKLDNSVRRLGVHYAQGFYRGKPNAYIVDEKTTKDVNK